MVVTMKNVVFFDVTSCRSCKNRRFGGTHRLHNQGKASKLETALATNTANSPRLLILFILMMEAILSPETSVLTRTTRRHITEDAILYCITVLKYVLVLRYIPHREFFTIDNDTIFTSVGESWFVSVLVWNMIHYPSASFKFVVRDRHFFSAEIDLVVNTHQPSMNLALTRSCSQKSDHSSDLKRGTIFNQGGHFVWL
jgi:hypothetical protein